MLTLAATNTLQGVAGTTNVVTCTLSGDEVSAGADTFKILAQLRITNVAGPLYTVPGSTVALVKSILLANTSASIVAVTLYVNGTAGANQICSVNVPANGEATFDATGWKLYDANGALCTTSSLAANAVDNTILADMGTARIKGRVTGGTGDPEDLTGTQATTLLDAATNALKGLETVAQFLELCGLAGAKSDGTRKTIFRPVEYSGSGTYDPTGASDSTPSFSAMMTAYNTLNDRATIELQPGVFKVDPAIITGFGTAPMKIRGPSRGTCVLIPNSAGDFVKLGAGSDGNSLSGFAIYNTAAPFASGSGINTNDADSVLIEDMMFVDLFIDVRINGRPTTATTNGTINVSGISPVLTAGDVGKPFNGVGLPSGTTIATQAGATCTLTFAATTSVAGGAFFVGNTIKCSVQRTLHSQSNGNASSVGIRVENGDAGDTYIGPDVVMSNTGTTRRRASVELIASGHYEIIQANLTGSAQATLADPGASQIVAFGFHTNVLCDSCTVNGMSLIAALASATIKNIKSVNSWYSGTVAGTGLSGVVTSGAGVINGISHSCDRMLNNQRHGYEHAVGTDFRFSDCDMKGNNAANAAIGTGYDGLNVAAGVSNLSVNGGKYGGTDTAVTSPNQRYGINVLAGAGNNIKIAADDLSGNRDGPLQFGATGAACFISGCPGLPAPYARGAPSASISTVITIANMLIPKNSTRVGTTFRVTAALQHITTLGTDTFTVRCGTTNDAVGSAATNGVVVTAVGAGGAANDWCKVEFLVTVSAIGSGGNINAQGAGTKNITPFSTATAARASGAGFLAVALDSDKYLTLAVAASAGADVVYTSTIEVVNY